MSEEQINTKTNGNIHNTYHVTRESMENKIDFSETAII